MSLGLLTAAVEGAEATRLHARQLLEGFAEDRVTSEQLAAALTALRIRGESPDVLAGFAEVLRERLIPVEAPEGAVDLCGTGGDGQHTVNLSTAAAFVVAGAGVPVAKHGNHGVSSRTGSADVVGALGLPVGQAPEASARLLREVGLAFLYAPDHHPLFARIGPVRRALGFRTAFNLLGPVCNPARVERQVVGVATREGAETLAQVLCGLGTRHALVVHTPGPYDEVSLTVPALALEVRGGAIQALELAPEAFGTTAVRPEDLKGGDAIHNAARIEALLRGEDHPLRRVVCANAACALRVAGLAENLAEGFRRAEQALEEGTALGVLQRLRAATRRSA